MDFTRKIMEGYLFVDADVLNTQKKFEFWLKRALEFNKIAKESKQKKTAMKK